MRPTSLSARGARRRTSWPPGECCVSCVILLSACLPVLRVSVRLSVSVCVCLSVLRVSVCLGCLVVIIFGCAGLTGVVNPTKQTNYGDQVGRRDRTHLDGGERVGPRCQPGLSGPASRLQLGRGQGRHHPRLERTSERLSSTQPMTGAQALPLHLTFPLPPRLILYFILFFFRYGFPVFLLGSATERGWQPGRSTAWHASGDPTGPLYEHCRRTRSPSLHSSGTRVRWPCLAGAGATFYGRRTGKDRSCFGSLMDLCPNITRTTLTH